MTTAELNELSLFNLRNLARKANVAGWSSLTKPELVKALAQDPSNNVIQENTMSDTSTTAPGDTPLEGEKAPNIPAPPEAAAAPEKGKKPAQFTGEGKTKYIRERLQAGVETQALITELVQKFPGYDPKKAKSTINVQRSALKKLKK